MDSNQRREFAGQQLDRVLGFFPRVDAKASALFAIDTALLALLCLNVRMTDVHSWLIMPAGIAILLVGVSLYFVFVCSFPHLAGGQASVVYFREIARRTEANFIEEVGKLTEVDLTRDLLGQIWRNSAILKIKFDAVKAAAILTILALIPWGLFLAATAVYHGQLPLLR